MQDMLVNQYNEAQANNPDYEYSLLSNSCVDHVRGSLGAAGIDFPKSGNNTVLPNSLFNALSELGSVTNY